MILRTRVGTTRCDSLDMTTVQLFASAITLVSDLRRPVFADIQLAKRVLASLLSDEIRKQMYVRAFTLMPDHLHLLAGVREPKFDLRNVIGNFKSFSTQLYWKRSHEIVS